MKVLRRFYWLLIALAAIGLDQLSKYLIVHHIPVQDSVTVIPGFFSLSHVRNTGAAFGLFANQRWVFMVFTGVVLLAAVAGLCSGKVKNPWGVTALALIIGGGVGNMIDRIFLGEVIDFFAFNFWGYQFAVFNVADIFVCCGTFILAFYIFLSKDFNPKKQQKESEDGTN